MLRSSLKINPHTLSPLRLPTRRIPIFQYQPSYITPSSSLSTSAALRLRAVNQPSNGGQGGKKQNGAGAGAASGFKRNSGSSTSPPSNNNSNTKSSTQSQQQSPIAERPPHVPSSISTPSPSEPYKSGEAGIGYIPQVNDMSNPLGGGGDSATVAGEETKADGAEELIGEKAEAAGANLESDVGKLTGKGKELGRDNNAQEEVFEVPDKPDLSQLPSLDIDPSLRSEPTTSESAGAIPPPSSTSENASTSSSSSSTGAKSSTHSLSSIERQRRTFLRLGLLGLTLLSAYGAYQLATDDATPAVSRLKASGQLPSSSSSANATLEERALGTGAAAPPPASLDTYWLRFKANFADLLDHFNKPAFEKLLPDPLPPTHQRPYTLLVDLEDMLVKSSWDRQSGWKTAKRPGVDYFLAYLSQFYEIVLFTTQPPFVGMGVADKLDPFQAYLPYRLYRESSRYVKGKIVKDLTYLNRDLSKVILLDTNPDHAAAQPENAIIMPKWDGTPGDKGLIDYIPFLESIGIFAPADVRPTLKAYSGLNIPAAYAQREAQDKQIAVEQWEREHGASGNGGGVGAGWLRGALGSLSGTTVARSTQPTTYLEAKRLEAQKNYQLEQEYWKNNAEEIKRLMEEDIQKQMAAQKGTLMGWMGGAKPAEAT